MKAKISRMKVIMDIKAKENYSELKMAIQKIIKPKFD